MSVPRSELKGDPDRPEPWESSRQEELGGGRVGSSGPSSGTCRGPPLCLAYWLNSSQGQGRSQRGQAGWEGCRSTASWGRRRDKHKQGWAGPDSSHTNYGSQVEGGQWMEQGPAPQHWRLPTRGVPGGGLHLGPTEAEGQRSPVSSTGENLDTGLPAGHPGGARSTREAGGFTAL